jgi:hypothetical protein
MKLLAHPTVTRALADPRALDVFVTVVRTKERIEGALDEACRRMANAIGLSTAQELRDLKIVVRDLERRLRAQEPDAI